MDEGAKPPGALDGAVRGLVGEEADAQEPGLGLYESVVEPVAAMAAFEHARPIHVPALPDPGAVCGSMAVAAPAVPERARAPGREADALVGGLVAGENLNMADAGEEAGGGAKNGRVSEPKPGSDEDVIAEGREAPRAARFRPGRIGAGHQLARAGGAADKAGNGIGVVERGAVGRSDVAGGEPDAAAWEERTGVTFIGQRHAEVGGGRQCAHAEVELERASPQARRYIAAHGAGREPVPSAA